MKSRTSFFDATHFRKNLTRFAPAWALYGVLLLLILITMVGNGSLGLDRDLTDMLQIYPIANILFAFLVAQLLWGDLYNSRMCNALHALPLRREGWFATNFLSGISFSLIPTLAALLFCLLPLSFGYRCCDNGFLAPLMVFLGANAQYLFFFGLAILSAFLVGSRFAMAVVYCILNFASLIIYWLADTLYVPLLYGVQTAYDPFILFSPVVKMCQMGYLDIEWLETERAAAYCDRGILLITDGWGYASICAAVGLVLTVLALLLYRRRKLECAGDFIAVRALEPVFLTVYTLVVGCVFQMIFGLFNGNDIDMFLFVGLVIGFFTGRMFLKRTVRVFQWKAWGKCAILIGVFLLTLLLTWLDPLGIKAWLPNSEQVRSVTVYANHAAHYAGGEAFTVSDSEAMDDIIRVHELVVTGQENIREQVIVPTAAEDTPIDRRTQPIMLEYKMKDGRTVRRCYYIWTDGEAGQILENYFASVECILGITEEEIPAYAAAIREVYVDGELCQLDKKGLLKAMAEDCKEGNLIQLWNYRHSTGKDTIFYIEFVSSGDWKYIRVNESSRIEVVSSSDWKYIRVNESSRHTLAWLEENGIDTPQYDEKFG